MHSGEPPVHHALWSEVGEGGRGAFHPVWRRSALLSVPSLAQPRNARERKQRQIEHLARLKHQREQKVRPPASVCICGTMALRCVRSAAGRLGLSP